MIEKKNKKYMLLIVLSAELFISGLTLLLNKETTINVVEHIGSVLMSKLNIEKEIVVYDGMRMEEGDILQTGANTHVILELDSNKIVKLGQLTKTSFEELSQLTDRGITRIFMECGVLYNDISEKLKENENYMITAVKLRMKK